MKRFLFAALLACLLGLSACLPAPPPEEEENLIVVGVSQVGAESDWRVANSESLKKAFSEERGYRLLFDDARQQQENQVMAVRKFIQLKVDYIVLLPIVETGWDSVLQEAWEAGIPVVLVDRNIRAGEDVRYSAHVGSDFLEQGKNAVAWMEETFQGRETLNIIHVQGTLGSTAQLGRTLPLEEALARHPGWKLLTQFDGDFTQAKTYEALREFLEENPGIEIDVLYCENDNESFGAIEALEEAGYRCGPSGVAVISFDATRNALEYCHAGKIALAVECNPLLGPLTAEVIQTLESGRVPAREHHIEEQVFTRANLSEALIAAREY